MADKNYSSAKYEYESDYTSDLDMHDSYIKEFDSFEAMLISKTYDSVSKRTKNEITDSSAATLIIERAARVVGQLPSGEVEAAGKKDKGKALFMDILRQKWVYPNANAQRPFLDKIRLWEMYSSVYGFMPMYYDWDVSPSGYAGPNCWLWSPRNFVPQQGRYSINDMDYVHAISYMSLKEVDEIIEADDEENSGWITFALKEIRDTIKSSSRSSDTSRDSLIERNRTNQDIKGRIKVVTRYESGEDGKWITFAPEYGCIVLRSIANPHKNGKIPFVIKPAIPLFDSFYNLSDMARAKPIQFAKDGLTNFYFQGIKMNIYPPTVVNQAGIVKHTVTNEPGAIWEEILPNSARRLETSTAGLSTYQAAMGQMSGALLNVFGTTDTAVNAESAMSPGFGKTPEALKQLNAKESARDNQNRAYLQTAIEELNDRMMELIVNMGSGSQEITVFSKDVENLIKAGYADLQDIILPNESEESGRIVVDFGKLKGVSYRFNMKPDSTIKVSNADKLEKLKDFIDVTSKHQNELQLLQESTGKMINWEQIFNSYSELADLPGIDNVFIEAPLPPRPTPVADSPTLPPVMPGMIAPGIPVGGIAPPILGPQAIRGNVFSDPAIAAVAQELDGVVG